MDGQHVQIDGCGFKAFGEVPRLGEVGPTFVVPAGCGFEAGHARQAVGFSVVGAGLAREADRLGSVGISAEPAAGTVFQLRHGGQWVGQEGRSTCRPVLRHFGLKGAEGRLVILGADLAERRIAGRDRIGNLRAGRRQLWQILAQRRGRLRAFAVEEECLGQGNLRGGDRHRVA